MWSNNIEVVIIKKIEIIIITKKTKQKQCEIVFK